MSVAAPARALGASLLLYAAASLVHFIHNAEFLADYPGLPDSWTRAGVYWAWLGLTAVGISGWWTLRRGFPWLGLSLLAAYALLGLDSLGHYVVAPMSDHSRAMNGTILLEVSAATLVLVLVLRRAVKYSRRGR